MTTKQQAKQQAVKDIKECLKQQNKAFIAFRSELNPIMDSIVDDYSRQQKSVCLSCWTVKP